MAMPPRRCHISSTLPSSKPYISVLLIGVSGVSSASSSLSTASQASTSPENLSFALDAFDELEDDLDAAAFSLVTDFSAGPSEIESSTMLDKTLNERVPGIPKCYDYLVGSCIGE